MRQTRFAFATGLGVIVAVLSLHRVAQPQGSGSSRTSPSSPTRPSTGSPPSSTTRPVTKEEFYQSFWKHLHRDVSPYPKWPSPSGKAGLRKADSPHDAFVKSFVLESHAKDLTGSRYGAILVAENYSDEKTLRDITVMYRVKGTDAAHNDWYWLKYLPDGSLAKSSDADKKPMAGKVASCIDCHSKAKGGDLVFFNDDLAAEQK